MYRSIRTDTTDRFARHDPRPVEDPTGYTLSVPGEPADRTFTDWATATRYAASAAARLRSAGRIDDARDITISEEF